jgi:hypothetical protein
MSKDLIKKNKSSNKKHFPYPFNPVPNGSKLKRINIYLNFKFSLKSSNYFKLLKLNFILSK